MLKRLKENVYLQYSMVFLVMITGVFYAFWSSGRTFIWRDDGWNQHYKAMVYYSRWIRTVAETVFVHHSFAIPTYTFGLGYGGDILTNLNYYVIGDPLTVLCWFVPEKYMMYCYDFLILLRLYLSGVCFMLFFRYKNKKSNAAAIMGSVVYIFSGYVLYTIMHPFFINPMLYLPLVLLGIERLKREGKPLFLTISVFVSAISNFYFFYMIVLFTVCYVIYIAVDIIKKEGLLRALKFSFAAAGHSLLGVLLSACVFLPVLLSFLGDTRNDALSWTGWTYSADYYREILQGLISYVSPERFNAIGYTAVMLIVLAAFFAKKRKGWLKVVYVIAWITLLVPYFGYIFNGFSYTATRHIWGVNFFSAYIVALVWDEMTQIKQKQLGIMIVFLGFYLLLCKLLSINFNYNMRCSIILGAIFIAVIYLGIKGGYTENKAVKIVLGGLLCLSFIINADYCYTMRGTAYVLKFIGREKVNELFYDNEVYAVKSLKDESFYRISGKKLTINANLTQGISSTQYFWSMSNNNINSFLKAMGNIDNDTPFKYNGLDDRTILNTLCSVKYYSVGLADNGKVSVPYGYEAAASNSSGIYKNKNYLPFGYTYDLCINKDEFQKLSMTQKEEAILQGVYLEYSEDGFPEADLEFRDTKLNYRIEKVQNVRVGEQSIEVTDLPAYITIRFAKTADCELLLELYGLEFQHLEDKRNEVTTIRVQCQNDENKVEKTLFWTNKYYIYNSGRKDFVINLNYSNAERNSITLEFRKPGIYTFDKMDLIARGFEEYEEKVEKLKEDVLENVDFHIRGEAYSTNLISGKIELDTDKILVLNLPYAAGWTAYVDGRNVPILKANYMFCALALNKGNHTLRLEYHTPGLKEGVLITAVTIIFMISGRLYKKKNTFKGW